MREPTPRTVHLADYTVPAYLIDRVDLDVDVRADDAIVGVNIPNGIPLVYELDADLKPVRSYYLGDANAIDAAIKAVANQGKAK
mgnify:CR=1 FL=1